MRQLIPEFATPLPECPEVFALTSLLALLNTNTIPPFAPPQLPFILPRPNITPTAIAAMTATTNTNVIKKIATFDLSVFEWEC